MKLCSLILCLAMAHALRMNSNITSYTSTKIAFHAVAMGPLASFNQIQTLVSSLRNVGKFQGPIVLTTDRPHCLRKNLQQSDLGAQVQIVTVNHTKDKNTMKMEKARVWQHMQDAGIPDAAAIVQIDTDVIIGKDLQEFLGEVEMLAADPPATALFHDQGIHGNGPHTGIMVTFATEKSSKCLKDWSRKMANMCIVQELDEDGKEMEKCQCGILYPRSKCDKLPFPQYLKYPSKYCVKACKVWKNENNFKEIERSDVEVEKLKVEQQETEESSEKEEENQQVMFDQQAMRSSASCMGRNNMHWLDKKYFLLPSDKTGRWDAEFVHATNTYRIKDGIVSADTLDDYIRDDLHLTVPSYVGKQECFEL
eukprot:gnl/MRDRNA2_/MRDRNA2_86503_c0_seq5.p1 gnl/MRDRNA2_/MRDRNA2_86503_c0~~gnl/MRDRNA2_/MRDRNA2_86503_c0_seq5.p1  ORF type:complete len:366 (+),score=68.63 gnl/MRDRNA2_/MRDRNA2_86503_c0_seq5:94-1191(+)